MKTDLPKVVETGNRKNLSEGRDYQMGFTILMPKNKKNEYVSLYPFSCCKDYLNDWAFTYLTKEQVVSYGLITDSKKKFTRNGKFYLGIKILTHNNRDGDDYGEMGGQYDYKTGKRVNTDHGPLKTDRERLRNNITNIITLLNWYDEYFKVEHKAKLIENSDPNIFIIMADAFWLKYGYRISFYSLMIRMAQFWNGEGAPNDFIEKGYKISLDTHLFNESRSKYNDLLKNGMPELDFSLLKKRKDYIDPDTDLEKYVEGDDEDWRSVEDELGDHLFFDTKSSKVWADSDTIHNGGLQSQLNNFKDLIIK